MSWGGCATVGITHSPAWSEEGRTRTIHVSNLMTMNQSSALASGIDLSCTFGVPRSLFGGGYVDDNAASEVRAD